MPILEADVFRDSQGTKVLSGAFEVAKKNGKMRFIADVGSNGFFAEPPVTELGLPYPSMLSLIVLKQNEELEAYGDDDSCCFYSWSFGAKVPAWVRSFAFAKKVPLKLFEGLCELPDVPLDTLVYPGLCVVPMGWEWSVAVIQQFQRLLAGAAGLPPEREIRADRRVPSGKYMYGIYVDNFDEYHVVNASDPCGVEPSANQQRLRLLKKELGVPQNSDKAVIGQRKQIDVLGLRIDGVRGRLEVCPRTRRILFRIGMGLLQQGSRVSKDHLRVFLGRFIWACMVRRPAMSILSSLFTVSHYSSGRARAERLWNAECAHELWHCCGILPLLFCDLRAEFSDKIYATDASLQGGGVVSCDIDHDTSVKLLAAVDFRGVSVDLKLESSSPFRTVVPTKKGGTQQSMQFDGDWQKMFSWRWQYQEHITLLETRTTFALYKGIFRERISAKRQPVPLRFFCLTDNQASTGSISKGRSPSRRLNGVLRRMGAWGITCRYYVYLGWIHTSLQMADYLTRW